jgi:hypothetical protein
MFGVQFDLSPASDLIQRIRDMAGDEFLKREIEQAIMPKVLSSLVNAVKARAPVSQGLETSGLLRDAIAKKQVSYDGGRVTVGMVGVDRNVFLEVDRKSQTDKDALYYTKGKRGQYKKGDVRRAQRRAGETYRAKIRPAKYFHLVEFGHKNRSGGTVSGVKFFQNTIEASRERVQEMIREGLQNVLHTMSRGNLAFSLNHSGFDKNFKMIHNFFRL